MTRRLNIPETAAVFQIPWTAHGQWDQVALGFKRLKCRKPERCRRLESIAEAIGCELAGLNEPLEFLCRATCSDCKDVCCVRATIWYDFKDLAYLYFLTGGLPACQIRKESGHSSGRQTGPASQSPTVLKTPSACCHLSGHGCRLSREHRPFVCTWYLCPAQLGILASDSAMKRLFDRKLNQIKQLRNQLENELLDVARADV